ncbi:MAG TPA: SdrD B-like domain-containing protein [Phycisphaerae bacterium]|jgi:hypothetical protein|nr:SdrD B-like domain-containing protein [Phycisphaerae bacterium]HOL28447.1 SdrD B-like domain-containing protein [Phycisphaerae bacterium]HPP22942.1 SdrD B-like domain-containing protein [Phycisphaerae bacterium]HPU33587.1 SdrD B-like domain-containing protein [Phycisphaerae bacterium]HQA44866.1 SdrD B-like domain-containing protein [Phycisphaerae bacterium]
MRWFYVLSVIIGISMLPQAAPASTCDIVLGDLVWMDLNGNGIQDDGEPGVAGVAVDLYYCQLSTPGGPMEPTDFLLTTIETDENGYYSFTLPPGGYFVRFRNLPAGFAFSPPDQGDDGRDSDADPMTGKTPCTLLTCGQVELNLDAGLVPEFSSLCGYVYVDCDDDGVFEAGERPIEGATITLSGVDFLGAPVNRTVTTGPDGRYCFEGLLAGTYTIEETQPAGYADGSDAQGTPGNAVFRDIILDAGVNGDNNNFGELLPASISAAVFCEDNDQSRPVSGVTIKLYRGDTEMVGVTGGDGICHFPNLQPGLYIVEAELPAGHRVCSSAGTMFEVQLGCEDVPVAFCICPPAGICPRTPGYWKNHLDAWPVRSIKIGCQTYDEEDLLDLLNDRLPGAKKSNSSDMTVKLAKFLIATQLSILHGSNPAGIQSDLDAAYAFLAAHKLGGELSSADFALAESIKNRLDAYLNAQSNCIENPPPPSSDADCKPDHGKDSDEGEDADKGKDKNGDKGKDKDDDKGKDKDCDKDKNCNKDKDKGSNQDQGKDADKGKDKDGDKGKDDDKGKDKGKDKNDDKGKDKGSS